MIQELLNKKINKIFNHNTSKLINIRELIDPPFQTFLKKKHNPTLNFDNMKWILANKGLRDALGNSVQIEYKNLFSDTGFLTKHQNKNILFDILISSAYSNLEYHSKLMNLSSYVIEKSLELTIHQIYIVSMYRDFDKNKINQYNYPKNDIEYIEIEKKQHKEIELMINNHFDDLDKIESGLITECSPKERLESEQKYAVKKKSTLEVIKTYKNESDALEYSEIEPNSYVEFIPKQRIRCKNYCSVNNFCNSYQQYIIQNK